MIEPAPPRRRTTMNEYEPKLVDAELQRRGMHYDGGEAMSINGHNAVVPTWYWQRGEVIMALQVLDTGDRYAISITADTDTGKMLVDDYSVPSWHLRPEAGPWLDKWNSSATRRNQDTPAPDAWRCPESSAYSQLRLSNVVTTAALWAAWSYANIFAGHQDGNSLACGLVPADGEWLKQFECDQALPMGLGYVPISLMDADAARAPVDNGIAIVNPFMDESGRYDVPLTYYDDAIMAAYHQVAAHEYA
jgi:hypothetical protein